MSIFNRNFGFIEQKMYFCTPQRVSSKKNALNLHYFCHEKIICRPFQSCPLKSYVSTTPRCAVPLKANLLHSLQKLAKSENVCKWTNALAYFGVVTEGEEKKF